MVSFPRIETKFYYYFFFWKQNFKILPGFEFCDSGRRPLPARGRLTFIIKVRRHQTQTQSIYASLEPNFLTRGSFRASSTEALLATKAMKESAEAPHLGWALDFSETTLQLPRGKHLLGSDARVPSSDTGVPSSGRQLGTRAPSQRKARAFLGKEGCSPTGTAVSPGRGSR